MCNPDGSGDGLLLDLAVGGGVARLSYSETLCERMEYGGHS
jgi:hypothetical protein